MKNIVTSQSRPRLNPSAPILVTCILEPRGECGLEGYQAGETYKAQYVTVDPAGYPRYWRVWPGNSVIPGSAKEIGIACYYETIGINSFHRYFAPLNIQE